MSRRGRVVPFDRPRRQPVSHQGRRPRRGRGLAGVVVGLLLLAGATFLLGQDPMGLLPDRVAGWLRGPAGDLRGVVTHVRDGDTIEVAGTPVRIANLDCAERGSANGDAAGARMRALVEGQEVVCRLTGRQSHDREVGTCALASSGEDLGRILIGEGACERWW